MNHERIIKILEYFNKYANGNKAVTIKEIQQYLTDCNIETVSSITIRRDIERLISMGENIEIIHSRHNTAGYLLKNKGFTFNEIRFIVDSVSINKFLSNTQKQRLIRKFEGFCSEENVSRLISRISLNGIEKSSMNLLENLDKVHDIISRKCKINFDYGKYDSNMNVQYYSKKREMIPCKVVYFDERFYLKCIDEETGKIRTYRIDRMKRITVGEKTKSKSVFPKYDGVVLDMFEPEYFEMVKMRVKRFLLDDMLEIFGKYISVRDDVNSDSVIIRIKVGISRGFYKWVMKYGENIEIISPENIRMTFKEKIKKVSEIYE